ncbi:SURF1 family protein [Thalassospira sp. TSL5-1]|uniref:SURF1 family protein n=1 Tax=Thalassospira sp. TSL5-1 TaxID=1544451 RepID=UPI00093AA0C9|nr:SURF1 family protein [Thalassospira sp. TSL5-1]OKH87163.1 hypothetical protein LF95_19530 [Thalassospira sp. TSL5-1]
MTQPVSFDESTTGQPRSKATRIILAIIAAILFCGFVALGIWQIERRAWKLDLIERVTTRVAAPVQAAPRQADWAQVNRKDDEYRHVTVTGTFLNDKETQVYTSTDYGAGYWVMTPMVRADSGAIIMINRGFVPSDHKEPATRAEGQPQGVVTINGLLRMDEPGGTFLRDNVPADNRWYSRDVKAMAEHDGLDANQVAPYFIDADAQKNPGGLPIGGLTQIRFNNSHLVYAITWFSLALMVAAGAWYALRSPKKHKHPN